jgi:transglycosylase-like protein
VSTVPSWCKRYWKALLAIYVVSSLWWGPAAEAAFHLDYSPGHEPTKGLPALVDVIGLRTQPAPAYTPLRASGTAPGARVVHFLAPDPWACIARYESGSDPTEHSGYYEGMYQFAPSTWRAAGGTRYAPHAYQASAAEQTAVAQSWLEQTSWAQWPNTSRRCGLR